MKSFASEAFDRALEDVDNLIWFHENAGGPAAGKRPAYFSSLSKSAVVLVSAAWETYVEFVLVECTAADLKDAGGPSMILAPITQIVSNYLREQKDDRAWHKIAGDDWKPMTLALVTDKVSKLNTPNTANVITLFKGILGIKDISQAWKWHKNQNGQPSENLDKMVKLRGAIAHGEDVGIVKKSTARFYRDLVCRLVEVTDAHLIGRNFVASAD